MCSDITPTGESRTTNTWIPYAEVYTVDLVAVPDPDRRELDAALATLSMLTVNDEAPEATLDRIVKALLVVIEHADGAGVALVQGRRVITVAASSDLQRAIDSIQTETGEGPCLEAIHAPEARYFRIDDMTSERRWPIFAGQVEAIGVMSKIAFVLDSGGETLGALNLYARRANAFDSNDEAIGSMFANHAAVALGNAQEHEASRRHVEQLEEALRSRDVIGQAKGILMAREGLDEDQAFDRLRQISQHLNVKLRDVATQIAGSPEGQPESDQRAAGP
jgi:transcriptional regulator with GAF, ATPase, and Fis domain